jgi:hypothetical protein
MFANPNEAPSEAASAGSSRGLETPQMPRAERRVRVPRTAAATAAAAQDNDQNATKSRDERQIVRCEKQQV